MKMYGEKYIYLTAVDKNSKILLIKDLCVIPVSKMFTVAEHG